MSGPEREVVGARRIGANGRIGVCDDAAPPVRLATFADPVLPGIRLAAGEPAIAIRNVSVAFAPDGALVVEDVSLTVSRGEHWALIGANGSGKSTLLNVIRGDVEPTRGDVTVLGEQHGATGFFDPALRIASVASAPPAFAHSVTVLDVVLLRSTGPAAIRGAGLNKHEVEHAHALLAALGCGHLADRRYVECSHGERQRINLARALLRDPEILLLDEPTTGVDLPGRAAFLLAMDHLAVERPTLATLTVSHHVEELPTSTSHAALLRDGSLIAAGAVEDTLTSETLSACFGLPVVVTRSHGGWNANINRARW